MKKLLLITAVSIGIIGCSKQSVNQESEAKKIIELSREWAKSAQTADTEKILSYWSDDAVVMSPNQPATIGKDELRKMLEMNATIPGFEINWEPKEAYVSQSGDLGYSIGANYIKMLDSLGNKITIYNKAVEIWKKQEDGSWKCVVDIFNSDPTITTIK